MSKFPIAIQLYTVRDLTAKDMPGTLKQVARIGYRYVELAGYGSLKSAAEMKKALDDAGLAACGAHVGIDGLEKDVNKALDEAQTLGHKHIVIPWLGDKRRADGAGYKATGQALNKIGAATSKRGIQLSYHNHAFEFQKFDGQLGLDILVASSDPNLVKFELDTCWAQHGGVDPAAYILKLGRRISLLHLKDMEAGKEVKFAPVGAGIMDFKSILAAGEKVGAQFGVVEQDSTYDMPPLQAIRTSLENLKKLGAI